MDRRKRGFQVDCFGKERGRVFPNPYPSCPGIFPYPSLRPADWMAGVPDETQNPYILTANRAETPPSTFLGRMKYLGPGLILTASIVGSGELSGTTIFGARASVGFC